MRGEGLNEEVDINRGSFRRSGCSSMLEVSQFKDSVTCIKTASPLGGQAIMWVYAYHINDVVFDAGCANAIEELRAYKHTKPVNRVVVTHNHEDHFGGCSAFLPEADVFAGPVTLKSVHEPYQLPEFFGFVWGQPPPVKQARYLDESTIVAGDFQFEVLDLSGHCKEMIGFWEPEQRWLFSADAVPLPSCKQMAMPEENIPKMIMRMKEIRDMHVEVLFDGHRGPIEKPQEHIDTRIMFLSELHQQIQQMADEGKSLVEIKEVLGFPEPWYLPNTENRFAVDHLIRSLLEDTV
jgi:glyoxylase-like metal-dependent hydrolase (beta-lactamase superfamily II)